MQGQRRVEFHEDGLDAICESAKKVCLKYAEAGRDIAREDHPWKNRTGTLEGSIESWPTAEGAAYGSLGCKYAIYLEFGTARMPAFPYLRPSVDKLTGVSV